MCRVDPAVRRPRDLPPPPPQITSFFGSRIVVRRGDGAVMGATVPAHAALLHEFTAGSKWEEAVYARARPPRARPRRLTRVHQAPLPLRARAAAVGGPRSDGHLGAAA